MFDFIGAPPGAIAVCLTGTIANDDLGKSIDRLEVTMSVSPTVDVFVETIRSTGSRCSTSTTAGSPSAF